MKKQRNCYIELLRFVASLAIMSGHVNGVFKGAWQFVEFFFILTGYFVYDHVAKRMDAGKEVEIHPLHYTWNKMKKLLPYTAVGMIIFAVIQVMDFSLRGKDLAEWLLFLPTNIFYLPAMNMMPQGVRITDELFTTGIYATELWYVCVMIAMIPVMMYLLIHFWNKKCRYWLITSFPMFLYGLLIILDGSITGWHEHHFYFFMLDLRALAGMMLGGAAWEIARKIEKNNYTSLGKVLLTSGEVAGFGIVLFLTSWTSITYEAMNVVLFLTAIGIAFSGKSLSNMLNSRLLAYLGKISLPIYCIHLNVIRLMSHFGYKIHQYNFWKVYLLVIGASIVLERVITLGEKGCKKLLPGLKKLVIAE